jgi:hypothetical protein
LAGRIAAELVAPQGKPYRFIAGLLQVWRAKFECAVWRKSASMPIFRETVSTGASRYE